MKKKFIYQSLMAGSLHTRFLPNGLRNAAAAKQRSSIFNLIAKYLPTLLLTVLLLFSFNQSYADSEFFPHDLLEGFSFENMEGFQENLSNRGADGIFDGFVVTGGLHTSFSADKKGAFPIGLTLAYTSGVRVKQPAVSINYQKLGCSQVSTVWLALRNRIFESSSAYVGDDWIGVPNTYYVVDCTSARRPELPDDTSVWLMGAKIKKNKIRRLADLRNEGLRVPLKRVPGSPSKRAKRAINLLHVKGDYKASGAGDVTTLGSIERGSEVLKVEDATTWDEGHGIRVVGAGDGGRDLIARVEKLEDSVLYLDRPAETTVVEEVVYHDDTEAVAAWLALAKKENGDVASTRLFAPAGVYNIRRHLDLPTYTHLRCANPMSTTFRKATSTEPSLKHLFRSKIGRASDRAPSNITIEDCGFDANGWNIRDFSTFLDIKAKEGIYDTVKRIHIQGNHFFDSDPPSKTGCEHGQAHCGTLQRVHVQVLGVDGASVQNNFFSDGGRIKAGRPGRRLFVRNNVMDFINDNAITFVDTKKRDCAEPPAGIGCLTESVAVEQNIIRDPVNTGIYFGVDGDKNGHPDMRLHDIMIRSNTVLGFFNKGILGRLPNQCTNIAVIHNDIRRFGKTRKNNSGITIKRSDDATDPAFWVAIEANKVIAGPSVQMNAGGVNISGSMEDLFVLKNEILCQECAAMDGGFFFKSSSQIRGVELSGNTITTAPLAIRIDGTLTEARFSGNRLFSSTNENTGQILLNRKSSLEGSLTSNIIHDGDGWGIYISDGAQCRLNAIEHENNFGDSLHGTNNVHGPIRYPSTEACVY